MNILAKGVDKVSLLCHIIVYIGSADHELNRGQHPDPSPDSKKIRGGCDCDVCVDGSASYSGDGCLDVRHYGHCEVANRLACGQNALRCS